MNGGYIMVDCTGMDLRETDPQTISGIYEQVETAYKTNKPVYAVNIAWGDAGYMSPVAVMICKTGAKQYSATSATLRIDITDQDAVTINNYIS